MATLVDTESTLVNKTNDRKELKAVKKQRSVFTKAILFSVIATGILELGDITLRAEYKHSAALFLVGIIVYSFIKFKSFGPRIGELNSAIEARKNIRKIRTGH